MFTPRNVAHKRIETISWCPIVSNSVAPFCLPWHFFFFFGLFSYSPCELLCSHYGYIGFNGAETNCGTEKILGILQMNSYLSYGLQILRLTTTSLLSSLCRVNNYYKSICGLQLLDRELKWGRRRRQLKRR